MTVNKQIRIIKLDKRYSGYRQFRIVIEFLPTYTQKTDRLKTFLMIRDWCHDVWGHTCERDLHTRLSEDISIGEVQYKVNPHWSWHWDPGNPKYRLYFKDQEELNMFTMRWLGE